MRKILFTLTIFLSLFLIGPVSLSAQSGGGTPSGQNDDSGDIDNPKCGNELPAQLLHEIITLAQPNFPGYSYSELVKAYRNCELTITHLGENRYLVAFQGGSIEVIADGF